MEQKRPHSNRKLFWSIMLPSTIMFFLGIAGCCALGLFTSTPPPVRAPEQFPDTEIVFDGSNIFDVDVGRRLGFVNADGSALTYITIGAKSKDQEYKYGTLPAMTGDKSTLVFLMTRATKLHQPYVAGNPYVGGNGKLVIVLHGEFPIVCENWYSGRPQLFEDGILVLNPVNKTLALHKLADCENSSNALPLRIYEPPEWQYTADNGQIETVPQFGYISPNEQLMAYRLTNEIVIRDLSSGEETSIGEGDYPAWSRDSQWLSYVGHDGIYIVKTDGTEKRRVVKSPYSNSMIYYSSGYYIPPWPAWSPDGQWLVYHLYTDTSVRPPAEIPIYKVNVNTGEVIKIVDYGIFPSWRWPAEQPGE